TIFLDRNKYLWIGTPQGIFVLDISTNKFSDILASNNLKNKNVSSFTKDKQGNVWIGTSGGVYCYKKNLGEIEKCQELQNLPDTIITSIKFDFENVLWIGTKEGGFSRYNPQDKNIFFYEYDAMDPNSLSVNSIKCIYEDSKNLLWIGTSLGGVEKWNRVAQELLVFRHNPYNSHSLSSSRVRSIFEDDNGVIWIGTVDGGLNKWNKDLQKFISIKSNPLDKNSLPGNHVRTIFKDSKNRYWIGTADNGLCIINPKTLKVTKKFTQNDLDSNSISFNSIWRIAEKKDGSVWFATYGGGLCKLENENDFIFKTYKHSNKNNSLSNDFCTTLIVDSKDRLWIGTNNGLNLFDDKNETFTVFKNNISDSTTLSNNRIYSIIEDVDGNIWIGTKGGLNKYLENGSFETYTVNSHDLSNNVIMGILEDSQKNLWLTTNKGLCKFNRETFKIRNFDIRDGIQSNEFLVGSFLKTKDGMFIVGGINGFNAFYPEKIKNNPNIPSIVITDFMISNKRVETDTNISEKKYLALNHKQNDLTFKFVSIDYILPEKNQYAYKLVGYDDDWVYSKYDRIAKYTNLPPGHYVFRVKGSNNDLVWNDEGVKINIYIKPALWQTLGFKIGSVLLIIFIFFFVAWLRMQALKRQKIYLEQEVNRQTKEIREKNEELQQQKEEIETQRDEIEIQRETAVGQRDLIAKHQKDMKDSIVYAKNIQTATMPANKFLQLLFEEYFIFFKPRDIVSGDFYWASQKNGKLIAVAADCTGHGVPGAFMSMLGISFLHKIVNEKGVLDANKILDKLRSNVIHSLNQTVDGASKDGMDIT
ncbi:MAG: two-component regulator propeller domain-containing protein, partial [Bacteroidota bacterium]|nr:two-component regulator propeller domain-containing protein [Bacteroidota bacterium]